MRLLARLAPPPRVVDAGLLVTVAALVATGLVSFGAGTPGEGWLFVVHGALGTALPLFLALKLWRVRHRLTGAPTRGTVLSVVLTLLALAALATGVVWASAGLIEVGGFWTLLNVHVLFGLLVVPVLLLHLRTRFRLPERTDASRRTAIRTTGLFVGGALVWRLQQAATAAFDLAGADRRFTGSKEDGSGDGNGFPVTSWVADDPDPVDRETYRLRTVGLVETDLALSAAQLAATDELTATLDCTSGWYSVHDWQGVRVGDLLSAAAVHDDAAYVRFRSVTGYRWTLPVEEARDALLATHVDGDRLTHGHGAPARLVAPGRRGFQWVKWVTHVEVRRNPDPAQYVVTLISGFD